MAYKNTFDLVAGVALCITPAGPCAAARVQVLSGSACLVQAGASATVAPSFNGALRCEVYGGFGQDRKLSDLFGADVADGGTTHLWVLSDFGGKVAINHA